MNDDRCVHVPISPGQKLCACQDNRIMLETIIELQARHIAQLQSRLQRHKPQVIVNTDCTCSTVYGTTVRNDNCIKHWKDHA